MARLDRIKSALPGGSAMAIVHPTADFRSREMSAMARAYSGSGIPVRMRDHAEVARFFAGWDLLPPGLVPTQRWQPPPLDQDPDQDTGAAYAGIAVKPP